MAFILSCHHIRGQAGCRDFKAKENQLRKSKFRRCAVCYVIKAAGKSSWGFTVLPMTIMSSDMYDELIHIFDADDKPKIRDCSFFIDMRWRWYFRGEGVMKKN